jgi:hypothetical protein
MLNGISVAFSTVDREENYLPATLESFFTSSFMNCELPLNLILGSPEMNYLSEIRMINGIHVIEMGPNVWSWIKGSGVRHRATWNYYRCLTHQGVGQRGSLIFEDDVQFAYGWRERLNQIISMLEALYDQCFILSVYDPWSFRSEDNLPYAEYDRVSFFGTQGMYFPAETRLGFAKYLKKHGVVANEGHYDHILRDYALENGILIFACTPSLIQHIGRKTTGLGTWHFAPNFVEDVRGLPIGRE